jgi:hypothetical protein
MHASASLSTKERALLAKSLSDWSGRDIVNASWRAEALAMVLWAGSQVEIMQPYDVEHDTNLLMDQVPIFHDPAGFVTSFKLRPSVDIERARDVAELWHWRAQTTRLVNDNYQLPDGQTFETIIADAAESAYARGDLESVLESDFVAFSKPYHDLSQQEWSRAISIAMERQYALSWLCGYNADWDEITTDT